MATGDDAIAAGMDVLTGSEAANTLDTEMNKTRDYIAQRTSTTLPVNKGGTGSTTASGARTNLGIQSTVDAVSAASATASDGVLIKGGGSGRINVGTPIVGTNAANKTYVDGAIDDAIDDTVAWVEADKFAKTGGTVSGNVGVTGHVYVPNATAANTGTWTIAYINGGDGRLSKGASSERFKTSITYKDSQTLGRIFPDLYEYVMVGDVTETVHIGYIAERLAESDTLRRFVVYETEMTHDGEVRLVLDAHGNPIPESIDFIGLLLAQTAQLAARVFALEAQLLV